MTRTGEILYGIIPINNEEKIEEIRIKRGCRYVIRTDLQNLPGDRVIYDGDFDTILSRICRGSYHTHADTASEGYIDAGQGVRVGVAGEAVCESGRVINVRKIDYMVIRVPHLIRGVAAPIMNRIKGDCGCKGTLIYSRPGVGKTTLLRDISISLASPPFNKRVVMLDARRELYLPEMENLPLLSSFSGYPKGHAMRAAVRSSTPDFIISDEIGSGDEANALLENLDSGVSFIASVHAGSLEEVKNKRSITALNASGAFSLYCGAQRGKNNVFLFTFSDGKGDIA